MPILQSWSQGVEVWGRDGMLKLWSAANVLTYGGGVCTARRTRLAPHLPAAAPTRGCARHE
jgi:hypothetical protein